MLSGKLVYLEGNMRFGILAMVLAAWGCAASHPAQPQSARPVYLDAPATALVLESPYVTDPVFLSREDRQPAAFVGFEDLTATFFYVRSDDQQIGNGWNHHGTSNFLYRQAISEKAGVSYR